MEKITEGVVVPLITPLAENHQVDERALERLIDYVTKGGVDSLFILGTTGEGPCLGHQAKNDLIAYTSRHVKGRMKVMVGITDTSPEETIKWSYVAADKGADAVVLAPPPYFPYTQEELVIYVRYIVRHSPLPVLLYNIPRLTKTTFGMEAIQCLIDEEGIRGFKDSSRDWTYFQEMLLVAKSRPDWTILTGTEELLVKSMEAGANGGVLGGANLFPELLSRFYNAIKNKNSLEIANLESILSDCRRLYSLGTGVTSSIQAIKYVLEQKGICKRTMTVPFQDMNENSRKIVLEIISHHLNNNGQ